MPRRVKGPDGIVRTFPDDATDEEIVAALEAASPASPSGAPMAGVLPMAGGLVGSLVGTLGGIPGRVAGAGLGGALGKGAELFLDEKDDTLTDSLRQMGSEAVLQGGAELAGGAIGKALKAGAPRLMQSVLKPSKTLRQEFPTVAQDTVKAGTPIGAGGQKKVGTLISSTHQKVNDKLALSQRMGARPVDMKDVVPELQGVAQKVSKEPLDAGAKLQELSDIGGRLLQQHPTPIPLLQAQEMKQAAQRVASQGYKQLNAGAPINAVTPDANMAIARGLRKEIEQRADVAGLNEQTQRLMGVERALDDAMGRIANNQPIGMNALIAAGAGGATGLASQDAGVGGGVGLGILALTNPWLASRLAIGADRIAPAASHIPNAGRIAALMSQLENEQ